VVLLLGAGLTLLPGVADASQCFYPYVPRPLETSQAIRERLETDGLWRPSLLDPASYPTPETSGSALFCYALAWGMRHGVLDRDTYWPVVERAWQGLARSVRADGRLGWVQLPASLPERIREETTAPYGVGAFLLAGSEVLALVTGARASAPAGP
jgi:rhamnogalacturonyl hydrolase YesR